MRIIGIDPGYKRTGIAILEQKIFNEFKLLHYTTIEVSKNYPTGLIELREKLLLILDEYDPKYSSIENVIFYNNQKTNNLVLEARGVIVFTLTERKINIVHPSVTQIKKGVTGSGKADKKMIQKALKLILRIDELKGLDDSWDAIAAAIVGLRMIKMKSILLDKKHSE